MPRLALIGLLCLALAPGLLPPAAGMPPAAEQGQPLQLASVHAAVGPVDGDALWFGKREDRAVPIASLTKVMTAMVVLDSGLPLDEWLIVVERSHETAKNAYSRIRIGSELTRGELLRLALMSSENLAAHVLASHHPGGREAFVDAMNDKARALGMQSTRFVDPSGLSPENRSTAADLLTMARAAHGYQAIREYSTTTHRSAAFRSPRYNLGYGNTNPLVSSSRWPVVLSKTGYLDEAGRCLLMVTEVGDERVAMVFLNSRGTRSPLGDAGRTRRWLTTGEGGSVAPAARSYEQEQAAQLGNRDS